MLAFDWDDGNRDHIALHGVSPEEAEQAYRSNALELRAYEEAGEERFDEVGQTGAGCILKLVTTMRGDRVRIVTAYEPNRATKRMYHAYLGEHYE